MILNINFFISVVNGYTKEFKLTNKIVTLTLLHEEYIERCPTSVALNKTL